MRRPWIDIVVAHADNRVIGENGAVPWHLPQDLRHFRRTTIGAPMIMGRKTFESLPKILPGRRHIVLTHNDEWSHEDVLVAHTIDEAFECVAGNRVSIIGGAEIYREFLPITDRIHLTQVHLSPEGDTFFPTINKSEWASVTGPRNPAQGRFPAHTFVTLLRREAIGQGRKAPDN